MVDFEQYARDKAEVKEKASERIAGLISDVKDKLGQIYELAELADISVETYDIRRMVSRLDDEWNSSSC